MKLYFSCPQEFEKNSRPIESMLKSYCRNFGIQWVEDIHQTDGIIFYGKSFDVSKPSIFIPYIPQHRIPSKVVFNLKNSLPLPEQGNFYKDKDQLVFTADLLQFLAGQLYRAEEYLPQHKENSLNGFSHGFLGETVNFFDRPIVDLWFSALFRFLFKAPLNNQPLKSIWDKEAPSVWLTHDVDILQKWTWRRTLVELAKSPYKILTKEGREDFSSMYKSWVKHEDPRDCLQKIIDIENPIPSTFFFMGSANDHIGRRYNMLKPRFKNTLRNVQKRNREVGLHGGPQHVKNHDHLEDETIRFKKVFDHDPKSCRQHYLIWDISNTPVLQDRLGIEIDSTLGFNNRTGYRCGTAMPFKWYDLEKDKEIDLIQVPLLAADHQIHDVYTQGKAKTVSFLKAQFETCRKSGGIFTSLFHNMYFSNIEYPEFSEVYQDWINDLQDQKVQFWDAKKIRDHYLANEP